jgi:hypothetical protein
VVTSPVHTVTLRHVVTLQVCTHLNTHCFSTATMVARTRLNVTSCVHWLSWCVMYQSQNILRSVFQQRTNWLAFITEKESVYCAVRSESVNITQLNLRINPRSAYEDMRIYYIIRVAKHLRVSTSFCGHLQGGVYTKTILHRQTNRCTNGKYCLIFVFEGRAIAQVVSRPSVTAEARFRSQASLCEICGERSDSGTGFSLNTPVFPWQYHSITAPTNLPKNVALFRKLESIG